MKMAASGMEHQTRPKRKKIHNVSIAQKLAFVKEVSHDL